MSLRRVLVLISILSSISCIASANDSAFGGSGSLPMPITNSDIAMVAEQIEITGSDLQNPQKEGRWNYSCKFSFKNHSSSTQTLQMGFPFPINNDLGAIAVPKGKINNVGDPLVYDFKITTSKGPVQAVRSQIKATPDWEYKDAYLWSMSFAPHESIDIKHTYSTGATNDVQGFTWVHYVLKTGALWRGGVIGHTYLIVKPETPTRLCSEVSNYTTEQPLLPGMQRVEMGKIRSYVWDLKDFTPKSDLSLCLQTGRDYVRFQLIYPLIGSSTYDPPPLKTMSAEEKRYLKNSIFAQYGRNFKNPNLQQYFDKQWWYEPNSNYTDAMLNKEDKAALEVLK